MGAERGQLQLQLQLQVAAGDPLGGGGGPGGDLPLGVGVGESVSGLSEGDTRVPGDQSSPNGLFAESGVPGMRDSEMAMRAVSVVRAAFYQDTCINPQAQHQQALRADQHHHSLLRSAAVGRDIGLSSQSAQEECRKGLHRTKFEQHRVRGT